MSGIDNAVVLLVAVSDFFFFSLCLWCNQTLLDHDSKMFNHVERTFEVVRKKVDVCLKEYGFIE